MKGFVLPLLGLLLLPTATFADAGSVSFRDAFRAYAKVRELEEKSRITNGRTDLEQGQRLDLSHKIAADLSAARIDFQAFLRPAEKGLSAWEREVLRNAGSGKAHAALDKAGLDFLSQAYGAKAKSWSPLEWETAGDWFGKATEDAFLKVVFGMEALPASPGRAAGVTNLVWLSDPLSRYLSKDDADRLKAGRAAAKNRLEKQGFVVEDLEIGAFTRLDEQAEELHLTLAQRIEDGPAFTIVSSGYASAVLLRALDLNPGLLVNPSIHGWVNVNGQLFGEGAPISRAPASLSKADRPLHDAWHELLLLRQERLAAQPPLGAKFPVLNLVTLSGAHRPGPNLRDSLLPEGKSVYVPSGDAIDSLRSALPLLQPRAPAGQRDVAGDAGL